MKEQSNLQDNINGKQKEDTFIIGQIEMINDGKPLDSTLKEDGSLWFKESICVPHIVGIKNLILKEPHQTRYYIHPGNTKMYMTLKITF